MAYQNTLFKMAEKPEVGTRLKGVVTNIEEGSLGKFIDPEVAKKWENFSSETKAIKVTMTSADNKTFNKVITLPANPQSVSAKSTFAKWKNAFGDFPKMEQVVWVDANADGYYNFPV